MRRDLIIGILVSVLLHGGFAFGAKLFEKAKTVTKAKEEVKTIALDPMPELPPEEPEPTDSSSDEAPADVSDIAPPMQADVPSVAIESPFVQQVQPPPPPSMSRPGNFTIPAGKPGTGIGKGMKDLFDIANLDQAPTAKFQANPVYPFEMRRAGITGEVVVGFIVDDQGKVRDAYAVRSTQREFEAAAIQAVMKWTFRPGKKGGRSVNTRMQVPIVFSITED